MSWVLGLLPSKAKLYALLGILLSVLTLGVYRSGWKAATRRQEMREVEEENNGLRKRLEAEREARGKTDDALIRDNSRGV